MKNGKLFSFCQKSCFNDKFMAVEWNNKVISLKVAFLMMIIYRKRNSKVAFVPVYVGKA